MRPSDPRLTSTIALIATAVWLGGMLALGAIVAPIVFGTIPRPEAVDAMTAVFARFQFVTVTRDSSSFTAAVIAMRISP